MGPTPVIVEKTKMKTDADFMKVDIPTQPTTGVMQYLNVLSERSEEITTIENYYTRYVFLNFLLKRALY